MLDERFIAVLRRHLRYLAQSERPAPEASLAELGLDSMRAVTLLLDLESEFRVTLPESSLTVETFSSVASLWREISKATGQSHPLPG